jgi:uncharacterized protein YndB with AHSA1/START domain
MARKAETPALDLDITRLFDAPRDLVFKLWTDPQHLIHWWGPQGFRTLSCELDLRPGGAWRIYTRSPDGTDFSEFGVFREVVAPERIVFTHGFDMPGKPRGPTVLATALFTEENGKTRLTFHQGPFATIEDRDGHEEGWSSSFDLLSDYLRNLRNA